MLWEMLPVSVLKKPLWFQMAAGLPGCPVVPIQPLFRQLHVGNNSSSQRDWLDTSGRWHALVGSACFEWWVFFFSLVVCFLHTWKVMGLCVMISQHGRDFSRYNQISRFTFLTESNKNSVQLHFECVFSPFRIQTLTLSCPCQFYSGWLWQKREHWACCGC